MMKSKKRKSPDPVPNDRKRGDALNDQDKNQKQGKLPGDYPPQEDIMNRLNTKRVGMDVENFSRTIGTENLNFNEQVMTNPNDITEEPLMPQDDIEDSREKLGMEHPVPRNLQGDEVEHPEVSESDVTEEDLQALGPKDLSMDMGEDEQLKNRVWPVDMAGEDLDVPGSELDDANEAIGSEDEENNSYSLGGDAHEDNLEGK